MYFIHDRLFGAKQQRHNEKMIRLNVKNDGHNGYDRRSTIIRTAYIFQASEFVRLYKRRAPVKYRENHWQQIGVKSQWGREILIKNYKGTAQARNNTVDRGIIMQFMNSIKGGKQTDRTNFLDSGVSENQGIYRSEVGCGSMVTLGGARSHKSQYNLKGFQVKGLVLVGNHLKLGVLL